MIFGENCTDYDLIEITERIAMTRTTSFREAGSKSTAILSSFPRIC